ncbi:FMRFamide receptor-like [Penaeus indicus]|uniref:FMRFamide receptor-like n=1 Tax=Penaeus indicus TaxID=29960 RepID=UPI00300CCE68
MRSSINCCLIGLSVFDMIVALTAILMWGIPEICRYTVAMMWYYRELSPKITPFIYPLALIAHTGSAYLTVTVTLERYVAVCQPLKVRSICTYGRAKIYVLSVTLFAVLYNLPRWWEITYKECDIGEDVRHFYYVATQLRNDNNYKQIYIMWMFLVVIIKFEEFRKQQEEQERADLELALTLSRSMTTGKSQTSRSPSTGL